MFQDMITEDTKVCKFSSASEDYKDYFKEMGKISSYENWIKQNGVFYYYKYEKCIPNNLLNELIGEVLTSILFHLPTVHYYIGYDFFQNKHALLSKNFLEPKKKYYSKEEMNVLITSHSDDTVFQTQQIRLLNQMKKLAVLDFYCQQKDRHLGNCYFECKDEKFRIGKLYDYECSFGELGEQICLDSFQMKRSFLPVEPEDLCMELKEDETYKHLFQLTYRINMLKVLEVVENKWKLYIPEKTKQYYLEYQNNMRGHYKRLKLI